MTQNKYPYPHNTTLKVKADYHCTTVYTDMIVIISVPNK